MVVQLAAAQARADAARAELDLSPGSAHHRPDRAVHRRPGPLRYTALTGQPTEPTEQQAAERPGANVMSSQSVVCASPETSKVSEPMIEPSRLGVTALRLDDDELDTLRLVAPLVGSSPRQAKRFLNTYRVSKARALGDPELRDHLDARALLTLTAVAVGLGEPITPNDTDAILADWLQRDPRLAEFSSGAGRCRTCRCPRCCAGYPSCGDLPGRSPSATDGGFASSGSPRGSGFPMRRTGCSSQQDGSARSASACSSSRCPAGSSSR